MAKKTRRAQRGGGALARALELVRARTPVEAGARNLVEARAVLDSNRWYNRSRGAVGVARGFAHKDGKRCRTRAVVLLVKAKKPRTRLKKGEAARPVKLSRRSVPVDVVEFSGAVLHAGLGIGPGVGPSGQNPGSLGAILQDPADGTLYALSAAHVLAQRSVGRDSTGKIRPVPHGSPMFDLRESGVVPPGAGPAGVLADRALFDFANEYAYQSVDAAIFRLDAAVAARLDRAALTYSGVGRAQTGDRVDVMGIALPSNMRRPGPVIFDALELKDPQFEFGMPDGTPRAVRFTDLLAADYEADKGDSGGSVVRTSDRALVGLHLGAVFLRFERDAPARKYAVFIDIQRVLGRWPRLRLWL